MIDNRNVDPDRAMLAFSRPTGVVFKRGPIFLPEVDPDPFDPQGARWRGMPKWLRMCIGHDSGRGRLMEHVRR